MAGTSTAVALIFNAAPNHLFNLFPRTFDMQYSWLVTNRGMVSGMQLHAGAHGEIYLLEQQFGGIRDVHL